MKAREEGHNSKHTRKSEGAVIQLLYHFNRGKNLCFRMLYYNRTVFSNALGLS